MEQLHFHFSLSCIGEGNGNPLQGSCLENPRDGGAWWAAVYGSHRVGHNWSDLAAAASADNCKMTDRKCVYSYGLIDNSIENTLQKSQLPHFIGKSLSAQLVSSILESTIKDMSKSNHHFWSFLSGFRSTLIYTLIPLRQIKISLCILFL